jgi:replicative DNA helicase
MIVPVSKVPGFLFILPENLEAEQALLGTLLAMRAEPMSDMLKPEHFADPLHRAIYEAILGRWDAWQTIDLDAIASAVALTGLLSEAEGTGYLTQLVIQSGALSAEEHARSIALAYLSRTELREAHEAYKRSAEGEGRP